MLFRPGGLLCGVLAGLWSSGLAAQAVPIQRGAVEVAGTAQLTHRRDIGNDVGFTVLELAPKVGLFVAKGLVVNANLRFQRTTAGNARITDWGVGPGVSYYLDLGSRKFYPFVSGRTLFTWERSGNPSLSPGPGVRISSRAWLVSGGGLFMLGTHVGITGELFYQHERLSGGSAAAPQQTSSSETYGLQWGIAAFVF